MRCVVAGIHTGAVYTDPTLFRMGLTGEGVFDRTVIAIKTHYSRGVTWIASREQYRLLQYDQVGRYRVGVMCAVVWM